MKILLTQYILRLKKAENGVTFDYAKCHKVRMLCKMNGGSVSSTAPIRYVVALPMHQNAEIEMRAFKKTELMKQRHLREFNSLGFT